MSPKCLVRGSINVDEYFTVADIVRPGQTISSKSLDKKPGGKGANQAAAVARACEGRVAAVDLVGAVGSDGIWVKDLLERAGVNVDGVSVVEEPTGRAIIQLTDDGENSIILLKGANHAKLPESSKPVSEYTHVLLQNEITWEDTVAELQVPSRTSIYNPSPMPSNDQITTFPWSSLTWLIVNEGEALDLLHAFSIPAPKSQDVREIVTALSTKLGKTNIVCTLGANGVAALIPASQSWVSLPAAKLQGTIRDTTGAGDCFAGYMTAGLMEHGEDVTVDRVVEILKKSVQAAGMCVERRGAMEAAPGRAEVEARLA